MSRRDGLVLAAITLAGVAVRIATLDVQSFDHDEAITAGRVILPDLFDTLDLVVESERSPPLFYLVSWAWATPFGTGEVGLRSLSALIGALTIPAAWLAGRELVSARAGLVTAALVAFNPLLVWYSQEARSYAFLVLFATLALAFFARSARRPTPSSLGLWAASSALALLSHYFAIFLIAPQVVWLLASARAPRRTTALAVAGIAAVGLALLPVALAQEGENRRNAFADRPVVERAGEVALDFVASEELAPFAGTAGVDAVQGAAGAAGAVALAAAVALVFRGGSSRERRGAALAGTVAASATLVPLGLALIGLDFANPRNLVAGVVPVLALVGVGFACERHRRIGIAASVALCVTFLGVFVAVNRSDQMQRPDWRAVAEAIGPATDSATVIVTNKNGGDPLRYYLGAESFEGDYRDGVRVSEIDLVSTIPAVHPPPGFELVEEVRLQGLFFLRHLRASRPRLVRPSDLADDAVLQERSEALIRSNR